MTVEEHLSGDLTGDAVEVDPKEVVRQHLDRLVYKSNEQPRKPRALNEVARTQVKDLLKLNNAVLVAHYYTDPLIQALAEESGGCVADSLEMARFGKEHPAATIVVAGVRFMGETAKILTPNKRVLMPTLEATCSLDLGCPADKFSEFCDAHPDRTVVVYANTSAAVKARADWVVTSSIAVDVVDHLDKQGEKILWAPDRHLGAYVQKTTGADVLLWDGSCIVHEEFKAKGLQDLIEAHPGARVLVHPESPQAVVNLADYVGSTSQLIEAARKSDADTFIVATDQGIFYKMQQACQNKTFLVAPTAGIGATCRSCANCPWMAMNSIEALSQVFSRDDNEIHVAPEVVVQAFKPLERMLNFKLCK